MAIDCDLLNNGTFPDRFVGNGGRGYVRCFESNYQTTSGVTDYTFSALRLRDSSQTVGNLVLAETSIVYKPIILQSTYVVFTFFLEMETASNVLQNIGIYRDLSGPTGRVKIGNMNYTGNGIYVSAPLNDSSTTIKPVYFYTDGNENIQIVVMAESKLRREVKNICTNLVLYQ